MYGLIKCVKKRDGKLEDFDIGVLEDAILTTMRDCNEFNEPYSLIREISSRITFSTISEIEKKIAVNKLDPNEVPIDIVREAVESSLYNHGYHDTAVMYVRNTYKKIIEKYENIIKELKDEIKTYEEKKKCKKTSLKSQKVQGSS